MATLGEQTVGSIVKLNVNGTSTEFIVVHQGLPGTMYDASCDGTWLTTKSAYTTHSWDGTDNDYANSDIHSYLNNTFINLLDDDIKNVVKQVKIPYTSGKGNTGSVKNGTNGLSTKVFLLSGTEIGRTHNYANVEGAAVSYNSHMSKSGDLCWLRSPQTSSDKNAWTISSMGFSALRVSYSADVFPAMILPEELEVTGDGSVIAKPPTVIAITGSVKINGVLRPLTGEGYINIIGVLRPLVDSFANIGGTLESLKGDSDLATLPSGYTQVEYLQSSGTQYIDVGVTPNNNTRIVMTAIPLDKSNAGEAVGFIPYGAGVGYNNRAFECYSQDETYEINYGSTHAFIGSVAVGQKITIDHNKNSVKISYDSGSYTSSLSENTFTAPYTMTLFAIHRSSVICGGEMRMYSCQIYDNGTLIRDLIPCKNPSGVAGLYDLVNDKFYINNGSGAFAVGA